MASIRKRNGKYHATVYIGKNAEGKQLRKYVSADTQKECKRLVRDIETQKEERKLTNVENIKLSIWIDKWLKVNKERLSPSTFALYNIYANAHYKKYFNNIKLKDIHEIHIKEFINDKLEKPLSPTTVRKLFFVLSRILEDALKQKNPCRDIEPPKKAKYVPFVPTKLEFEKIYNAFTLDKYRLAIQIAGKCGLRRGEIFALKWNDIDEKNKMIIVDEARALDINGDYIYKKPKSSTGIRKVPCPVYLIEQIEAYRKKQKSIRNEIFEGRLDNFSRVFSDKMKEIKLPNMRFHDLRHYCASWLYEQGIPDHIAAEMLGHDVMILKQIYQHIGVDKKDEIFNKIRNLQDN